MDRNLRKGILAYGLSLPFRILDYVPVELDSCFHVDISGTPIACQISENFWFGYSILVKLI